MGQVALDENGLRIQHESGNETFLDWNEIYSIHISKVEIPPASTLTYLTFDSEHGEYIELNDKDEGWQGVLTNLGTYIGENLTDLEAVASHVSPEGGTIKIYPKANNNDKTRR